jgi:hypothetical protein
MTAAPGASWTQDNHRCTGLHVRRVTAFLADGPDADVAAYDAELATLETGMDRPPAMATIQEAVGLSAFEQDLLALCAAVELDEAVRRTLADARADNGAGLAAVTFGLALALLPQPHWSALTPQSPLRRWSLVDLGSGAHLTTRPITIAERVLHALNGARYLDESIGLRAPRQVADLTPAQARTAAAASAALRAAAGEALPAVQILSRHRGTAVAVAAATAHHLGLAPATLGAREIPLDDAGRAALARRLEREAVLAGALLVVDASDADQEAERAAARLVDELAGPVAVVTPRPVPAQRNDVRLPVPAATAHERLDTWTDALGPAATALDGQVARAAELFDLDPAAIRSTAAAYAGAPAGTRDGPDAGASFWQLVRERARPRLDHLTDRVRPRATWETLVLPRTQLAVVRDLAAQVRARARVHGEWGFDAGGGRGTGISALFCGPSGTGKTMTAEVIAADLDLDLYRIDLSRVVSKYIGETEKNLGSVFDEAEGAGAILLFDEADALFGRRSEVHDSHDRYANLEVSYLLQRMESYDGLAILTTNQREALDPAFLRRLRFAIPFPFPDLAARSEIWRRIFPPAVPTQGLDTQRLGQLNVAGGNIRTMALNAAFYAAAEGRPVRMAHVLRAARAEFAKLDRPLPEAQVRGWI